jgi:hypothetical protein
MVCGRREALAWATPINGMSHIAVTESLDGKVADRLEKVTNEQYAR